jgi:hypothetical protein
LILNYDTEQSRAWLPMGQGTHSRYMLICVVVLLVITKSLVSVVYGLDGLEFGSRQGQEIIFPKNAESGSGVHPTFFQ